MTGLGVGNVCVREGEEGVWGRREGQVEVMPNGCLLLVHSVGVLALSAVLC